MMRARYSMALGVGSLSSLEAKACDPHIRTAALASSSFTNIRRAKQRLQYFSPLKHFSANRRSLRSCGVSLGSNAAMFLTIRSPSLPPPRLGECCHRALARRRIAVGWRPVLMMAEGQRPHPRRASRSCMDLEDAADNFTARKHVEIVPVPVAGGATCRCAFEDEVVLLHVPHSFRWHFRHVKL